MIVKTLEIFLFGMEISMAKLINNFMIKEILNLLLFKLEKMIKYFCLLINNYLLNSKNLTKKY